MSKGVDTTTAECKCCYLITPHDPEPLVKLNRIMTVLLSINTSAGSVDLHRNVCRASFKSIIRPLLRVYNVIYVPNAVILSSGFQIMEYVRHD